MGSVVDVFDDSEDDAADAMEKQSAQAREDYAPFTEAGVKSSNALMDLYGLGDGTNSSSKALYALTNSPGYQFGLDQGLKTLSAKNAGQGQYFSGAQAKSANRYAQNYATNGLANMIDGLNRISDRGAQAITGVTDAGASSAEAEASAELEDGNDWATLGDDVWKELT